MSLIGNILWLIFGGLAAACGYFIGGIVCCCTIIGIPFGLQAFKLGFATLWPFGKQLKESRDANSPLRVVFNLLWILLMGWGIAATHLAGALVCALSIIGLPFAVQHMKLVPLALLPFGRDLE